MNILTQENLIQERNYIPIDIETRFHACNRQVISLRPIRKILPFYHVKRSSLYRWLKRFDGTKESLYDKSHKPLSDHSKKLKPEIVKKVLAFHRRNSNQSFIEI